MCLQALQKHPELWNRYFSDFTYHVLKLDIDNSTLSGKIIGVVFPNIHTLEPVERIAKLHIYAMFNRLDFATITQILRPLEAIKQVAEQTPNPLFQPGTSEAKHLSAIQDTGQTIGDPLSFSRFIISSLFSALHSSVSPQQQVAEPHKKHGML